MHVDMPPTQPPPTRAALLRHPHSLRVHARPPHAAGVHDTPLVAAAGAHLRGQVQRRQWAVLKLQVQKGVGLTVWGARQWIVRRPRCAQLLWNTQIADGGGGWCQRRSRRCQAASMKGQ